MSAPFMEISLKDFDFVRSVIFNLLFLKCVFQTEGNNPRWNLIGAGRNENWKHNECENLNKY